MGIMNDSQRLEQARDDFALAFYRWSQADAEKQAMTGFPLFALLRDSLAERYLGVYKKSPPGKRSKFLQAMIKRTHSRALELATERITEAERDLISMFTGYSAEESEKSTGRRNRPRLTTADRKELLQLVKGCVAEKTKGEYEMWTPTDIAFRDCVGPWVVTTVVSIKSIQNLSYEHSIHVPGKPDAQLKEFTSMTRWLGIGETNWNLMDPDELKQCAKSPIVLAEYFLDAIPSILAQVRGLS